MNLKHTGQHNEQLPSSQDEERALKAKIRKELEPLRASYELWYAETGDSYWSFDDFVDRMIDSQIADYHHCRSTEELGASIIWDRVTSADVLRLKRLLDSCKSESQVHSFLASNPRFLVQALGGGHGRYQLSKQRLGAEYVPDFLIAELDSMGIHWHAVEIESPHKKVYRQDGLATQEVHHAIGQITDWQKWLRFNGDYARRAREENGLGLIGIDSRLPGLILIGRREDFPERYNEFRRVQRDRHQIVIHSYDWLLDIADRNKSGVLTFELRQQD